WRYSLSAEANEYGTFWERQLSKIGIAGFVDLGNAFNSFLEPLEYGKLPLAEIAQNIAIAAGVGLRYDTSVGPFRVDLAMRVYDPAKRQFFFQLPNPTLSGIIQNLLNVQIGLGHTF
ncbi:MAG: BamA/TamA family outer membrane protein, partial [Candidatus Kapabacteria bacterium]|nr:BamA/TamA family outer membrane protein [Candidatus Kapabacteria bacterium]